MTRYLLPLLLCVPMHAVTLSNVIVNGETHSSVRIYFDTDAPAMSRINYGKSTAYGETTLIPNGNYWPPDPASMLDGMHGWFITGLEKDTTIHLCIQLSTDGKNWAPACDGRSGDYTAKTSDIIGAHPNDPMLSTRYNPAAPTVFAGTYRVDACPDWQIALAAAAAHGDGQNYEIAVNKNLSCLASDLNRAATFSLPTRTDSGWIYVHTDGTLPPPGTRVSPADSVNMPKIINNLLEIALVDTPKPGSKCGPNYLGEFAFNIVGNALILTQCVPGQEYPITAVSGEGAVSVVVTAAGAAAAVDWNDAVDVYGVTGNTNANQIGWHVQAIKGNQITLESVAGNGVWDGSGSPKLRVNQWQRMTPVLTDTAANIISSSCTFNTWAKATDANIQASDTYFWCIASNVWQQMRVVYTASTQLSPFNFQAHTNNYWLRGIEFTEAPAPDLYSKGMVSGRAVNGYQHSYLLSLLGEGENADDDRIPHDIVLEQIYSHPYWDYSKILYEIKAYAANNVMLKDSWGKSLYACPVVIGPYFGSECLSSYLHFTGSGNQISMLNNYIENAGVAAYQTDESQIPRLTPPLNWWIARNYFTLSDKYFYRSPASNGWFYGFRHHIEFKLGRYIEIDGNILEKTFSQINQGNAIQFSSGPAGLDGMTANNTITTSDITITNNIFRQVPEAVIFKGHLNISPSNNKHYQTITGSRIKIANNIVAMEAGARMNFQALTEILAFQMGFEDVQILHNTFWPVPDGPAGAVGISVAGIMESLTIQNNIINFPTDSGEGLKSNNMQSTDAQQGIISMDTAVTKYPDGNDWIFRYNVWGRQNVFPVAHPDSDHVWYDGTPGFAGTPDPQNPESYKLITGPYRQNQESAASDGKDIGVDVDALLAAQAVDGSQEDSVSVRPVPYSRK